MIWINKFSTLHIKVTCTVQCKFPDSHFQKLFTCEFIIQGVNLTIVCNHFGSLFQIYTGRYVAPRNKENKVADEILKNGGMENGGKLKAFFLIQPFSFLNLTMLLII